MGIETEMGGAGSSFPPTRWTLIRSSHQGMEARHKALDELLAVYWKPLYFFSRRKGLSVENSKDAVQGFFMQLLESDFPARVDQAQGTLRAYLRSALANYLANLHERQSALKRGGGSKTLSLDFDAAELQIAGTAPSPDAAYDKEWALSIMERALQQLRGEFERGERRGPFQLFVKSFQMGESPSYEEAAAESKMPVSQYKAFLHRTRMRFRDLVRQEVAETVSNAHEADIEVGALLKALTT